MGVTPSKPVAQGDGSGRSLWDRFWRDSRGRIVIVQVPNPALVGWLLCATLSRIVGAGEWKNGLSFASSGFLFAWAYLELTQGVNFFRRLLGLAVILMAVGWHIR